MFHSSPPDVLVPLMLGFTPAAGMVLSGAVHPWTLRWAVGVDEHGHSLSAEAMGAARVSMLGMDEHGSKPPLDQLVAASWQGEG